VAKLSDADLDRLVAALGPAESEEAAESEDATASKEPAPQALNAALASANATGRLGEALTRELRAYLNADITCRSAGQMPALDHAWRFEGTSGKSLWWVEFDDELARELARTMIGAPHEESTGTLRAKLGKSNSRSGHMLARLAARFLATLAGCVEAPPPRVEYVSRDVAADDSSASAGGSCSIAGNSHGWRAGVATERGASARSDPRPGAANRSVTTRPGTVAAKPERGDARGEPDSESSREPELTLSKAVRAAASALAEAARVTVTVSGIETRRVAAPVMPKGQLRLAFTTGGQGSLVLSADRGAVEALVSAALDGPLPTVQDTGAVVVAAAETLMRAALSGFAQRLTSVAGEPHRVLRLVEGALPARSPHYTIASRLSLGDRVTALRWLVPAWMAGEERTPPEPSRL